MILRRLSAYQSKVSYIRHAHVSSFKGDSRWPGWGVVIGIEVHAQIKSRAKLFSNSWTSDTNESPNTRVSAYDASFPGTLPRLNPVCADLGVRTALALDSTVCNHSSFDRKHYFYSDLPAGYQITQHYAPLATGGHLQLPEHKRTVRIKQIQLEQDTGKSTFDTRKRLSTIDLNRAGTGLMEIVSEPDLRSPEEAGEYVRTLQALLRAIGSSDGNMEQGSLRCDVNVSVNRLGEPNGTRCEIKNLNSVKFMMVAVCSEVYRQIELLESGSSVPQETRGFNEERAQTYSLRSKEDAPDYRYMPDPNLPPLLLTETYVDSIRRNMPDLPAVIKSRLVSKGVTERDADVLMTMDVGKEVGYDGDIGRGAVAYFEEIAHGRDAKSVVNWITHELLGQLSTQRATFKENPVSAQQMGELIDLVQNKFLTGTSAKTVLRTIIVERTADTPLAIAQRLTLLSVPQDASSLEGWCQAAIDSNPEQAAAIRKGNLNVLNKLLGHVMKVSKGRANAQEARATLQRLLSS